ncbi:hypothetical protein ACES2L_10885 [Bdellovibrio bacteriovorus]
MKLTNIIGSIFPWKDFPEVELQFEYHALKCNGCGEMLLSTTQIKEIDELLERSIRKQLSENIEHLKKVSGLKQKTLAKKLGLTEVYLSEMISAKKTPSLQMFNYFKLLTLHPEHVNLLNKFTCDIDQKPEPKSNLIQLYPYLTQEDIERIPQKSSFINILDSASLKEAFH